MTIRGRLASLERLAGPPPGPTAAVLDGAGNVLRLLAGGEWTTAPEGMTAGDLSGPVKVYVGIDPDEV